MQNSSAKGLTLLTVAFLALPLFISSACGPSEETPSPTLIPTPTSLDDAENELRDNDEDGSVARDDCDDDNADIYPGADETCDAVDNDCDLEIDEGFDRDNDGHLDEVACSDIGGDDCDDTQVGIAPGEEEVCDGVDSDCDGLVDEDPTDGDVYYPDSDGDTFGDGDNPILACSQPSGTVNNTTDCDDTTGQISPTSREECDEIDNDCDGDIDENVQTAYYLDQDGDGYGPDDTEVLACERPGDNYVTLGGDCNDDEAISNPGQSEFCDGIDNNCDGEIDGSSAVNSDNYYEDLDGDGFGNSEIRQKFCEAPEGWSDNNQDCNDENEAINPDAAEVCGNDTDEDCDGNAQACQ